MDIPNAGHLHSHALDAFKQKHDKTLRELMNHIYEQAKAGKFNLDVSVDDVDDVDCVYILKDYGYIVIPQATGFRISW